jgi:ABC-2 type transport system permease protein
MKSCLVRYRENVMLLVVFTSVPLLFLSGISWPQSAMPGAWQGVAMLFPSTFGVRGFVRMNTMGATLNDIQPEYIALWIQAFVYFVGTCIIKRIKKHEVEILKKKALEEGLAKEQNLTTEQN